MPSFSPALDLTLNLADRQSGAGPAGLLVLSGSRVISSPSASAAAHRIIRADNRLARIRACRPNLSGERAFDDVDLSASTLRLALGIPGQDPYCLATLSDPFPPAAAQITSPQSATADLPATKRITLDPAPYAGSLIVTVDALDPFEIPFDALPDQIAALLPADTYSIRRRASNAWEISGLEPGQDVTIAVDVTGLLVPVGVSGTIELNTDAVAAAFAAAATGTPPSEPKFLRVCREVTIDGEPVFQDDKVELAREILNLSALVPTPLPPSDVATINTALAGKQPISTQLTALAALTGTAFGRALLTKADGPAILAYLSAQPLNFQLSALSLVITAAYGRDLLTASNSAAARLLLDLDQIDNTADAAKPISAAAQVALDLKADDAATVHKTGTETIDGVKTFSSAPAVPAASFPQSAIAGLATDLAAKAPLDSPALLGTPTAPTPLNANSSTLVATTAFVHALLADLLNAPPSTLDTLKELADALGDDPNFATTVATSIATKLAKASNLADLTDAAAARGNLALGNVNNTADASKPVSTAQAAADTAVANAAAATLAAFAATLSNVNNTSDSAKPVSTLQQAALDLKAALAGNNTFTGQNIFQLLQTFNAIASRSVLVSPLANPGAPTVTPIGTDEGVTRSYQITALLSDGVETAAGPAGTTTHSDETLDATNRVSLTWTAIPGAASYNVYRLANDGTSPATIGKIANVSTNAYVDTGAAGDGATPPTINVTGRIRLGGPSPGDTPFPVTASVAAEEFGAGPDKTGDENRDAIQKAIAAMALPQNPSGRTGSITFNAEGLRKYPINGRVYLYGGVTLDGGNTGVIFAQEDASAPATVQVGDDNNNSGIWSHIRNVTFQPAVGVVRDEDTYEISLYNCTKTVVENVDFKDVWGCLKVGRITGNQGMAWFNNIHAEGFQNFAYTVRFIDAFFNGIVVDPKNDTANVWILDGGTEGCHFDHIESTGGGAKNIWFKTLVYDPGSGPQTFIPRDNVWTNSNIDSAITGAVHDNGDMNSIVNCWFSNRGNALVINGGANLVVALCRVYDCDATAFVINGGTDFSLIDNLIREGGGHGVAIGNGYTGRGIIRGGHFIGNVGTNLFIGSGVTGIIVNGTRLTTPGTSNLVNGSPDGVILINVYADGILVRPAWLALTPQTGWTNFGAPYPSPRYQKDALGYVHVIFAIAGGTNTSGTLLFNIPAGYGPTYQRNCVVSGPSGPAIIRIEPAAGGAGFIRLDVPAAANTFLDSGHIIYATD